MKFRGFFLNNKQKKQFQYFLLLSFLFLVFDLSGYTKIVKEKVTFLLQPIHVVSSQVVFRVSSPFLYLKKMGKDAVYLRELELSHAQLLAKVSEIEAIEKENHELRRLLENIDRKKEKRIITSPISSYTFPAIAAGLDEGLREGLPVFYRDNLLGIIDKAYPHYSQVSLLVSKDTHNIVAQTESGAEGLLVGTGKRVILDYVSQDVELTVGQRVVTVRQPGLKEGMYIGTISKIEKDPTALYQRAEVTQSVSFFETYYVEIITEEANP